MEKSLDKKRVIGQVSKAALVFLMCVVAISAQSVPVQRVTPFELDQVKLLDGPFKRAMDRKCSYLLFLDNNRLLYSFRENNGVSTQGAQQYGGWEGMEIKGHTAGHVLSALAQAYQSTGDERYKTKADQLVTEMQKCQKPSGYLAAIPESYVDRMISLNGVWAPLYNIHKTFAGLLDCYRLLNNPMALEVAKKLGDWSHTKFSPYNRTQLQSFWNNRASAAGEFGGYNESLAELYKITGTKKYLDAAHFFDHDKLFTPCLEGKDQLNGLHANTSIPEIIGALKIYEVSGDVNSYKIAQNFFTTVTTAHSYINGGNSENEYFFGPKAIAAKLSDNTCETCNVYNMLKLAQNLFFLTSQPSYMDYYERALYNQILASQDTASEHGQCTYFQPMRSGGIKTYQSDLNDFKCCDGTGLENHTKYGECVFSHAVDTLFVNQFIASELTWTEKSMVVKLETAYPHSDTIRLTVTGSGSMPLKIRAPFWLQKPVSVSIDGVPQAVSASAGSYFAISNAWSGSSVVTVVLPQTLRFEKAPDDESVGGVMYGAQVLAGGYGTNDLKAMPGLDASTVQKASANTLRFSGKASTGDVTLVPFYQMQGQRYSLYWKLNNIPVVATTRGAATDKRLFNLTSVAVSPSHLKVGFSAAVARNAPLTVDLYTLGGARVIHYAGSVPAGDQGLRLRLPELSNGSTILVCSVRIGTQSFRRAIVCGK